MTVNNENKSALQTATITVQSLSSSDGGENDGSSSSSGGAGGSPGPQSNVKAKELSQAFIGSGQFVNFNFPQNVTPITNISFDSKKTTGKTTTIVEMLINQSTLVSEPLADETYKFINIWFGNGGFAFPDNIENAVVHFKVEKSWIQNTNIDKSSITLNKHNDTKVWNALPTNLLGEDDKYLYFTAKTTAFFSPFAIVGKIANGGVNATSSETQTRPKMGGLENNSSNTASEKQTFEQTQSSNTKMPGFETSFGIFCLLLVFCIKESKK